ncbi:MAG: 30S ribosomal protein S11 [Candidatus Levybacteria bacterium]|nr:30S ribosomal protein S11 [Candidatus Levybacteria bacterium]MBI2189970.1 30S ribosomal protein S11 [Candidatus Levybacteria bacterium]MBI2622904.1 30S ribosomal protein S11 [Candidatus Levybacteria bacterium]MBI3070248.1 30S ribosomal protein S11 [Candidatus Levybacteria bacterium]MBI3093013.1 30S ribosomal protein S11 [Candidatus Levybacteria bacterium]
MKEKKETKSKAKPKAKPKIAGSVSQNGKVYITSTFNNTLITVTNDKGDTIAWSSSGARGFKGTRRSTPYAATTAAEDVARKAVAKGIKTVEIYVRGPGSGRDAALRAIKSAGLSISLIADVTPIPHNGPRARKKRRV